MQEPSLSVQKPADPLPDEAEQERHAVTHLPFQSWCSVCVRSKSKEDRTLQNTDFEQEDSGVLTIQMDWSFLGKEFPALCMLDTKTRYSSVFPTTTKGAYRQAAEAAVRFSLELGYLKEVIFVMDSEPATLSLLDMVIEVRRNMGYPSSKRLGKPYHKGRTARVERQIQTMKHQASALVLHVEDALGTTLEDTHVLRAWTLIHSCFLLNRFHEHRALKATPYEICFGKKYDGKLMPFGEFCFGLKKPSKQKGVSAWTGGVWVGKDTVDMNIILTPSGQFASRSVRRCATPWRKDIILALKSSPWLKQKGPKTPGGLGTPLPVVFEHVGHREPREGEMVLDRDEEDVKDAESSGYAPTSPGGRAPLTPPLLDPEVMAEMNKSSSLIDEIDMDVNTSSKRSSGELAGEESPRSKAPRGEGLSGSPSSGVHDRLYAPYFAGQVEMKPHDDEVWDIEVEQHLTEDFDFDPKLFQDDIDFEGERPPDISAEELQKLDDQAMIDEVSKLKSLGVVEEVKVGEVNFQETKFIVLKEVYDWRHRQGAWKRRCRIVAREFRAGADSDQETFSPTTATSAVRLFFVLHLNFRWKLLSLDISDAYLTVDQVEECIVELRPWIKSVLQVSDDTVWRLKKVLPGQRIGAKRWFSSFSQVLSELGFESCLAMPSVFRHTTKQAAINMHVDDILVAVKDPRDGEWLLQALKARYKLQVEGPVPLGRNWRGNQLFEKEVQIHS